MLDFLKGTKTQFTLTLDHSDGVYYPGEVVGVIVEILPDRDLSLRSAAIRLQCTEWIEFQAMDTEHSSTVATNSCDLHEEDQVFLQAATLPKGKAQRYTFQFKLPDEVTPSFTGASIQVVWRLDVKMDRRRAKDVHAETPIHVRLPARDLVQAPGEYGKSSEPDQADMVFFLPGLEYGLGQTLSGELRVTPYKDFQAKVRVNLTQSEIVLRADGSQIENKLVSNLPEEAVSFTAGQQQIFPFQIEIPAESLPSLVSPNGSNVWFLKGKLDRANRSDTTITQSVTVL